MQDRWIIPPALLITVKSFLTLYDTVKTKPVMVCGPSGVGKSLFVYLWEMLFKKENGKGVPIKKINCAAFPGNLVVSELFGYTKGAFTGATNEYKGLIGSANGGLLVLEELGDIPGDGQAQLLTFLEDGCYRMLGSTDMVHSDVKIIATTNKKKDDFRPDFWHRFYRVEVPPLYKRRRDILYYFREFFPELFDQLKPYEVLALLSYPWPGNVREIEQVGYLLKVAQAAYLSERVKPARHWTQRDLLYSGLPFVDEYYTQVIHKGVQNLKQLSEKMGKGVSFFEKNSFSWYGLTINPSKRSSPWAQKAKKINTIVYPQYNSVMLTRGKWNKQSAEDPSKNSRWTGILKEWPYQAFGEQIAKDFSTGSKELAAIKYDILLEMAYQGLVEFCFHIWDDFRLVTKETNLLDLEPLLKEKASPDSLDQVKKGISNFNKAELLAFYHDALLERTNGIKKKAAEIAQVTPNTFAKWGSKTR